MLQGHRTNLSFLPEMQIIAAIAAPIFGSIRRRNSLYPFFSPICKALEQLLYPITPEAGDQKKSQMNDLEVKGCMPLLFQKSDLNRVRYQKLYPKTEVL